MNDEKKSKVVTIDPTQPSIDDLAILQRLFETHPYSEFIRHTYNEFQQRWESQPFHSVEPYFIEYEDETIQVLLTNTLFRYYEDVDTFCILDGELGKGSNSVIHGIKDSYLKLENGVLKSKSGLYDKNQKVQPALCIDRYERNLNNNDQVQKEKENRSRCLKERAGLDESGFTSACHFAHYPLKTKIVKGYNFFGYVNGMPLSKCLRSDWFLQTRVQLAFELLKDLQRVHDAGKNEGKSSRVHCDVKSANVVVSCGYIFNFRQDNDDLSNLEPGNFNIKIIKDELVYTLLDKNKQPVTTTMPLSQLSKKSEPPPTPEEIERSLYKYSWKIYQDASSKGFTDDGRLNATYIDFDSAVPLGSISKGGEGTTKESVPMPPSGEKVVFAIDNVGVAMMAAQLFTNLDLSDEKSITLQNFKKSTFLKSLQIWKDEVGQSKLKEIAQLINLMRDPDLGKVLTVQQFFFCMMSIYVRAFKSSLGEEEKRKVIERLVWASKISTPMLASQLQVMPFKYLLRLMSFCVANMKDFKDYKKNQKLTITQRREFKQLKKVFDCLLNMAAKKEDIALKQQKKLLEITSKFSHKDRSFQAALKNTRRKSRRISLGVHHHFSNAANRELRERMGKVLVTCKDIIIEILGGEESKNSGGAKKTLEEILPQWFKAILKSSELSRVEKASFQWLLGSLETLDLKKMWETTEFLLGNSRKISSPLRTPIKQLNELCWQAVKQQVAAKENNALAESIGKIAGYLKQLKSAAGELMSKDMWLLLVECESGKDPMDIMREIQKMGREHKKRSKKDILFNCCFPTLFSKFSKKHRQGWGWLQADKLFKILRGSFLRYTDGKKDEKFETNTVQLEKINNFCSSAKSLKKHSRKDLVRRLVFS